MADVTALPVIVGVDGSASSLEAVDWAGDYADAVGAPIELVAAWDWPNSYGWPVLVPDGYSPLGDADHALAISSERLLGRHPSLHVTAETCQGYAARVLVDKSTSAALLVVGSRGHGQFTGMMIGSVSEQCVSHAHCPVVVIRGAEKRR